MIDATCSASPRNPFGNVTIGVLKIRGVIVPARLMVSDGGKYDWDYWFQFGNQTSRRFFDGLKLDVNSDSITGEVSPGDLLYCLLIGNSPGEMYHREYYCLVLKNVGVNIYTRVGTFNIPERRNSKELFSNSLVTIISLTYLNYK